MAARMTSSPVTDRPRRRAIGATVATSMRWIRARRALEDELVAERLGEQRRIQFSGHSLGVRSAEDGEAPDGADHGREQSRRCHGDARPQILVAGVPPVMA